MGGKMVRERREKERLGGKGLRCIVAQATYIRTYIHTYICRCYSKSTVCKCF